MELNDEQINEMVSQAREIFESDLTSVGMIPTGQMVQMIYSQSSVEGFTLMCESFVVRKLNDNSMKEAWEYLQGPMLLPDDFAAHLIDYTVMINKVCKKLNRKEINGKTAIAKLLENPMVVQESAVSLIKMMLFNYKKYKKDVLINSQEDLDYFKNQVHKKALHFRTENMG